MLWFVDRTAYPIKFGESTSRSGESATAVSVRSEPRFDLTALAPLATAADLETARKLVRLIELRSYHRGRDLSGELERLVAASSR